MYIVYIIQLNMCTYLIYFYFQKNILDIFQNVHHYDDNAYFRPLANFIMNILQHKVIWICHQSVSYRSSINMSQQCHCNTKIWSADIHIKHMTKSLLIWWKRGKKERMFWSKLWQQRHGKKYSRYCKHESVFHLKHSWNQSLYVFKRQWQKQKFTLTIRRRMNGKWSLVICRDWGFSFLVSLQARSAGAWARSGGWASQGDEFLRQYTCWLLRSHSTQQPAKTLPKNHSQQRPSSLTRSLSFHHFSISRPHLSVTVYDCRWALNTLILCSWNVQSSSMTARDRGRFPLTE